MKAITPDIPPYTLHLGLRFGPVRFHILKFSLNIFHIAAGSDGEAASKAPPVVPSVPSAAVSHPAVSSKAGIPKRRGGHGQLVCSQPKNHPSLHEGTLQLSSSKCSTSRASSSAIAVSVARKVVEVAAAASMKCCVRRSGQLLEAQEVVWASIKRV
eukprot:850647-Amphidinium_carterae.1